MAKADPEWIQVLSDDQTPELAAVIHRITRQPMGERLQHSKDLGEIMVIAHAVVAAQADDDVTVLIDDGPGAKIATAEMRRLDRLCAAGHKAGSIKLISTLTILERAAGGEHIPTRADMRTIYQRLRGLDDGLPPIEKTVLLSAPGWT